MRFALEIVLSRPAWRSSKEMVEIALSILKKVRSQAENTSTVLTDKEYEIFARETVMQDMNANPQLLEVMFHHAMAVHGAREWKEDEIPRGE